MTRRDWWQSWQPGSPDPNYEPIKVGKICNRLVAEDAHRWLPIVNSSWRAPVPRRRGRHRKCY